MPICPRFSLISINYVSPTAPDYYRYNYVPSSEQNLMYVGVPRRKGFTLILFLERKKSYEIKS
jgi:hypothetical protein